MREKITLDAKKLDEAMHRLKLAKYSSFYLIQEVIDLIQSAIVEVEE